MLADDSGTRAVSEMSGSIVQRCSMRRSSPFLLAALTLPLLSACDAPAPEQQQKAAPTSGEIASKPFPPAREKDVAVRAHLPTDSSSAPPPQPTGASQSSSLGSPKAALLLPMPRILAIAKAKVAGEVLEVEFDAGDEDDAPEYEISILNANGRVIEIKIDATNGKILEIEED